MLEAIFAFLVFLGLMIIGVSVIIFIVVATVALVDHVFGILPRKRYK